MTDTLKRLLARGLSRPLALLQRRKATRALTQLTSHSDPTLQAIGLALRDSVVSAVSVQEQDAIRSIEKRRAFLLASDREVAIVDYGAGSPNASRTREAMEEGVHSHLRVADIAAASKSAFWATVLFNLIRELQPLSCVELGTCVGISASYQATALGVNGKGAIVTLEGSPAIARIAEETFGSLGLRNISVITGPFHHTLSGVLETSRPIDFFFNDGHHDHDAVIRYFDEAMPYLSDSAVIVFDDISWSTGMRTAWAEIEEDDRVSASIDLGGMGIAVVKKALAPKVRLKILL